MNGEGSRRGWWKNVGAVFIRRGRRDWSLHVPPEPPLLTTDAVSALLREVGILLDYLNRLPEARLNRYFLAAQPGVAGSQLVQAPQVVIASATAPCPPCATLSYFLSRIAAIAGRKPDADLNAITEPAPLQSTQPDQQEDYGAGEARRLGDLAFLIWTRDFLSSVAYPATLDTVRVTRAYRAHRTVGAKVKEDAARHTSDERDLFMSRYGFLIAGRVGSFTWLAVILL